ncbi:cation transporter [Oceanobacillus jordanicus]|uniref:Cation transporter n=1 Tax=Oceanobacillus jordanicus TaxID=2867266 RepID=A0AAW5B7Z2_9BACI|nr:cation transporter [Oceanobacillus jordanicus]MCG3419669.1 cation transporter [Oceanobacillus jordanicus]
MQATLEVQGMTCENCETKMKQTVESFNGVTGVEVHINTGSVDVIYDEAEVMLSELRQAVEAKGYRVVV